MAEKWMQKAAKKMEQKGTKGLFTKKAKAHGMSVAGYASQVLSSGSKASTTTKREAVFARNATKIAKSHK